MKIIDANYEILNPFSENLSLENYFFFQLKNIEKIGRLCYKSENKITDESYKLFIRNLIKNGHEAMIEHGGFAVRFIVDRGVSHEIVRHRIASFAQESTRYCNYSNDKFGNEITVIRPKFSSDYAHADWLDSLETAEKRYFQLLEDGETAQMARSVLPNSLKTEVVMTANFREWRNFFKLRTDKPAHLQMREVTVPLLEELKTICPVIFDDIKGYPA